MATILLVDDSPILRASLGSLLRNAGHTVVGEADNGITAYELYAATSPDLVLMDIEMPAMNGLDALRKIMYRYPSANIVMISGDSHIDTVQRASRLGAKHYLVKPINERLVLETVDAIASQPVT